MKHILATVFLVFSLDTAFASPQMGVDIPGDYQLEARDAATRNFTLSLGDYETSQKMQAFFKEQGGTQISPAYQISPPIQETFNYFVTASEKGMPLACFIMSEPGSAYVYACSELRKAGANKWDFFAEDGTTKTGTLTKIK